MLDLNYVRANLERVRAALDARGFPATALDEFIALDGRRRHAIAKSDNFNAELNKASKEIGALMKAGRAEDAMIQRSQVASLKEAIADASRDRDDAERRMQELLATVPNVPHESVPVGRDEAANVEVRQWGEAPRFDFEPQDHVDIGTRLNILDLERAAKIASARFAILRGAGARLERALINFMLDVHTREHGYEETLPPFIVNRDSLFGTGQLPKFESDLFKLTDERGLYLIPTAEVPVTNIHREEILDASQLPMKFVSYTPCFRSEAGSYGRDTRGVIRQHQFDKVELVKLSPPEDSYEELEGLTRDAEAILQRLGLHYRVVALSTGDIGASAAKTYDLEVWLPSQNAFREISSCSNFEAYQARRAQIRFRRAGGARPEYVHTLNGSGLAVGRTWLAVLENYQQPDGSVLVPEALRPYMGAEKIEPPTR
ncbi:MAG TPA: serine--tRNA ligase [Pyrinomonadaceae bacterium]|jgi:seryl-tRNA synthetase